jgi:hypothetical protein
MTKLKYEKLVRSCTCHFGGKSKEQGTRVCHHQRQHIAISHVRIYLSARTQLVTELRTAILMVV